MKKNFFVWILTSMLTIFTLTSCAGLGDYSIDLPDNFQVDRINEETIVISLIDESGIGSTVVPTKVDKVGWNEKYIIAKQISDKESYWIVIVDSTEAIGPLSERDFLKWKEKHDKSDKIKLRGLDYYKHEM